MRLENELLKGNEVDLRCFFFPWVYPSLAKFFCGQWGIFHFTRWCKINFLFKKFKYQVFKKIEFYSLSPNFYELKNPFRKKVTPKSGFVVFNIHLLVDKRDIWPMHKSLLQKNWADDQPSRFPSKNQLTHSFNHHLEFHRVSKQTQHWIFMTKLNFCSVLVL